MVALGLAFAFAGLSNTSSAQQAHRSSGLAYDALTRGPVPIPPSERALQTVSATPWFKVSPDGVILEGATFDQSGNMYFCDVSGRRVLRLTLDKKLSTVMSLDRLSPGGLALHQDGRLFIAARDIPNVLGAIIAMNPDGSGLQQIIPPEAGYMPNDLVFSAGGGFYFTDFKGGRRPIRRAESIMYRPTSRPSGSCCRALRWPTA